MGLGIGIGMAGRGRSEGVLIRGSRALRAFFVRGSWRQGFLEDCVLCVENFMV